jgi:hypothetical protein
MSSAFSSLNSRLLNGRKILRMRDQMNMESRVDLRIT